MALLATYVIFRDDFIPGRNTIIGYGGAVALLTVVMIGLYLLQERRRPTSYA